MIPYLKEAYLIFHIPYLARIKSKQNKRDTDRQDTKEGILIDRYNQWLS